MPELNIPTSIEEMTLLPWLEMISVMAYPSSEELCKKFKAIYVSKMKEEWPELKEEDILKGKRPESMSRDAWEKLVKGFRNFASQELTGIFIDSGGIPSLYNSPEYEKIMSQFHKFQYQGVFAGTILTYIWRMDKGNVKDGGSVNKAIFLIDKIKGEEIRKKSKNDNLPYNEKFIRQAWSDFKSVSHLWAAFGIWSSNGAPSELSPFLPRSFLRFISLAEKFRKFGTTHLPRAKKEYTLAEQETWFPPKNFKIIDFEFEITPLTPKELEVLEEYRAPKKL